jgi:Ca2+-dependent lipid-binding protein
MVKYCPQCGAPNEDDAKFCIRCGHQFPQEEQVSHQPPQQIVQPSTQPIQQTAQPSQQQIPTSTPKQKKEIDIDFWILVTLLFILGIIVYIFTRSFGILFFGIIIVVIIWGIYKIDEKWKALREFFKEYYQELKESRKENQEIIDKLNQLIDQLSENKSK